MEHKTADKTAVTPASPATPSLEVLGSKAPNRRERRERDRERQDRSTDEKGFVQPRARAYERRSGTGRPPNEQKRSGAGKGNWGKLGSEQDVEAEAPEPRESEVKEVEEKKEAAAPADAEKKEGDAAPAEKKEDEAEKIVITFDEYKKTHTEEKPNIALPAPRAAGDGTKQDWSKFTKLKKEEDILRVQAQKKKDAAAKKEGSKEGTQDAAAAAVPKTDEKKKQKKEVVPLVFNIKDRDENSKKNRSNFDEKKGSPSQAPDRNQFPTLKETIKSAEPIKA